MIELTPVPTVFVDSETWTRLINLSDFLDCVNISPCCACPVNCYNDVLPILSSDNFTFGFNFEVTSVKTINLDGSLIANVTGSWKTGTRQITVKGSEAPACFSVMINDECCFCFAYELIPAGACGVPTLLIESTYSSSDCNGNKYSGGYSNRMRIYADFRYVSNTAEVKQDDDDNVVSQKIRKVYEVRMLRQMYQKGYPINHLTNVILRGADITVTETDGTEYVFDTFGDAVNMELDSEYWLTKFSLVTKPCTLDFGCE